MESTTSHNNTLPIAAIFMCCLIWGTTFVIVKDSSTKIDPFLLSTCRNGLAVIALFLFILIRKKTAILKDKISFKYGSILGVLLAFIYCIQATGLIFTTTNHSAFISCSTVIMVPLFLYFIGWQKFTLQQVSSVLVVSIGLVLLTYQPNMGVFNTGDILTFIAAIFCAFHLIFAGHYVRKVNFMSLIFYQFLIAAIISFFGLFIKTKLQQEPILFKPEAIKNVLYLGLLGTLFCYFVTVWGQKKVSTMYTTLIFSLEPIFASTTSYFVLGESFSKNEFIGAACIFIGVIYYSMPKRLITDKFTKKTNKQISIP